MKKKLTERSEFWLIYSWILFIVFMPAIFWLPIEVYITPASTLTFNIIAWSYIYFRDKEVKE